MAAFNVTMPAAAQALCQGQPATLVGTAGDDDGVSNPALFGTAGVDVIAGLAGDDWIVGLNGDDILCGGSGNDTIEGGPGKDSIQGGGRRDTIDGGDDDDMIFGGNGNDIIQGGQGKDLICGESGDDVIRGGSSSDTIGGGAGSDTIRGGSNGDIIGGYDTLGCVAVGPDGRDRIKGEGGADFISGGPKADILDGNVGPDVIRGNQGNDAIDGGPATDNCKQGPGSGRVRNCEVADLTVKVVVTNASSPDQILFKVVVRNKGPNASGYDLTVGEDSSNAVCNFPGEDETIAFGAIKKNSKRVRRYEMKCDVLSGDSSVRMNAEVETVARDPNRRNNKHKTGRLDLP